MDILFSQTTSSSPSLVASLFPLLLMFLIFYFIVIRPQSKQRSEHEKELRSLVKGDRVLTRGGLIGKIIEFQGKDEDVILLDTENNSKIKIQKSFVLKKILNSKTK